MPPKLKTLLLFVALSGPAHAQILTFAAAEQLLVKNNPELAAAMLGVKAARADLTMASHGPNPNLSLSGNYYYGPYPLAPQTYHFGGALDSTVGVSQLIERGGKRAFREAAAKHEVGAASDDLSDSRRKLRFRLAQSYYALAAAEEAEQVALTDAALYRQSANAMQLRLKTGDVSKVDAMRMEVAFEQSEIALDQAMAQHNAARRDLALLIGEVSRSEEIRTSVEWNLKNPVLFPAMAAPDFSAIVLTRPDVEAAGARVSQAEAQHGLALSLKDADVTVGIQYEHVPAGSSISNHDVGVSLSFPLQIRYQNQGEIESAEVAREAAVAQLGAVKAAALQELQKAWSDLGSARNLVEHYQNGIVPKAEQDAQATEFAYKHGSGSLTDLLDARRTFHAVLLDAVNARASYAIALEEWQAAAGEPPTPLLPSHAPLR